MSKDILTQLLYEAQAYKSFHDIEKLVEAGGDLSMVPIQPLYLSIQQLPVDMLASILPKLSADQRQALLDIDLWKRDEVDPRMGDQWMMIYSQCTDQNIRTEFCQSEDFLLAMKSQFIIHTFDAEDPEYPEHDNYFLTEDNLLLFEMPEDYSHTQAVKQLVRDLYTELGPENAYTHLFKMVSDSYLVMEENEYSLKKERLRDFGFVDYYEAQEIETIFANPEQLKNFVLSRQGQSGELDASMKNQALHSTSLVAYQYGLEGIKVELQKIAEGKRKDFLHFNFVRLVNARICGEDALRSGSVAMSKVGQVTRAYLELGHEYARELLGSETLVLDKLDFVDLYRVGRTLCELVRRRIKRSLGGLPFESEDHEYFLGMYWTSFLSASEESTPKYKVDGSNQAIEINTLNIYRKWEEAAESFMQSLPYIMRFFQAMGKLQESGQLQDGFYMNYQVETIDFEAIMLSSFVNFTGGHFERAENAKIGVSVSELKSFYHKFFHKHGEEFLIKGEEDPILRERIADFADRFGLKEVKGFGKWLYQVMVEQMNGYEVDNLSDEDFRHVGGAIILNSQGKN